ncbi:MAG: prepilin-type N-terminal cleavage/methylation domain-containing protein [Burkholderiaceae bacterium]|jgi:type IV pilus assembly protein PilV|nr:prepilin-type N-terminal cleavage/methylation domain-containing protein [Burkholderiaceae bacterium]
MNVHVFPNRFPANARQGGVCAAQRRIGGFALIEALVALLLFSIGILGLMGLQARAVSVAGDAQGRSRAALIADQCASQMQLLATNATISGAGGTTQGATVAQLCNQPGWSAYVSDSAQGGLPGGAIQATSTPPTAVVPGGLSMAPLNVSITVTWTPPLRSGATGSTPSHLTTQTTLLLKNS